MKRTILTALLALVAMAGQGQTPTSALIRGRITNVPKGHEDRLTIHYTEPLQTMSSNEVPLQLDSLGRFEVEVPLMDTTPVAFVWTRLLLSPGEAYDVEMDGGTGEVIVKGRDARLCNEVIAHQPAVCTWDTEWMKTQTDAVVIEEAEKELARLQAANDSIYRSNPTLSQQWRDYAKSRAMASIASYLVQRRYVDASVRQSADGKLWQWFHDHFISQLPHPYTFIQDELGYIVMNYTMEVIAPRVRNGFNLRGIDAAISIALEQQADGTIDRNEVYADSLRTLRTMLQDYNALMGNGAPDSVLTNHPFAKAVPQYFSDTYLMGLLTGGAVGERETMENIERLKDLDMPEDVRDYARAVLLYKEIETYHAPLKPTLQSLVAEVRNDYLRGIITSTSSRYQVLAMRSEHEANLMPNEPLKGLTDGKEIFDKIIAPYRGRIVYVDFWGTWCGPCKMDLKNHTHPLHQALSDLPVTYLYLCNGSQTEAWRSTIAEYNLTGEHLVHYNLPAAQQSAVEKYLHVSHFPTYIIFDREGQRVTTEDCEPKPYHPEAVRRTMQEIMNRQ
ncbi:MAG: hypothetical protein IJ767_00920 [Bacteroidaceae bacterium]|nr:hypothetical protein [Bacteroidaceae bacterium]